MSEVKRYYADINDYDNSIEPDFQYVIRAADYDALRAENERLTEDVAEWDSMMHRLGDQNEELRAEIAALKAVPDGVEVVGVVRKWFVSEWNSQSRETSGWHSAVTLAVDLPDGEPLMTVAQHNAIVASLSAPAAGQDVNVLIHLLREAYTEFLAIKAEIGFRGNTIALIGRIDAALAAHKAVTP